MSDQKQPKHEVGKAGRGRFYAAAQDDSMGGVREVGLGPSDCKRAFGISDSRFQVPDSGGKNKDEPNRWADESMLQSQITNRKSQMARWSDEPVLPSQIDGWQSQV
jgi:hypothetical protein